MRRAHSFYYYYYSTKKDYCSRLYLVQLYLSLLLSEVYCNLIEKCRVSRMLSMESFAVLLHADALARVCFPVLRHTIAHINAPIAVAPITIDGLRDGFCSASISAHRRKVTMYRARISYCAEPFQHSLPGYKCICGTEWNRQMQKCPKNNDDVHNGCCDDVTI